MDRGEEVALIRESLYQRLLGAGFEQLTAPLRAVHGGRARAVWQGRCDIEQGTSRLVRLMANVASLPPPGVDVPISVTITTDSDSETWSRDFNGHPMRSKLRNVRGRLCERLGPLTMMFELRLREDTIEWQLHGIRYLGIPLPLRLFEGTRASEYEEDGRYRFDVGAALPFVGLLIRYRGWLVEAQ